MEEMTSLPVGKNFNVVMANDLIKAGSKMQPKDAIFIRYLISQISMYDEKIKPYQVKAEEIGKLLGIEGRNIYRSIKTMSSRIMKSVVCINNGDNKYEMYHWVDYCKYADGVLTVKIAEELSPYLLDLKEYFTKYEFEHIRKMKSYQTIGIYELLVDALGTKKFMQTQTLRIEASLIKRKLGILDKYSVFKNLQDRVVEKACEEIRENGIFWVEATPYKSGRKYVGFEFTVESINTHLLRIAKEEDRKKEEELREAEEQRRKELPVNEKAADEQMSLYDYTHDNLLAPNDPTPENKKVVIDGPDMDMMSAITVLRQNPGYTVDDLVKLGYSREVATTAYAINITYSL